MKYISGKVTLEGKDLPVSNYNKMKKFRFKDISIIPQYAMDALNPIRKIGKIINDLIECHEMDTSSISSDIKERLSMVDLPEKVLDMYPIELSGGMKQRMVMVISTLLNPSILIADEITSALDVSTQKSVVKMIKKFRDQKIVKSILFITHDISVLYQFSDSIIVMYAGKIVERAATDVILKNPSHPYTRLLISSLPEIGIQYKEKKLSGIPGKPPFLLNPPKGCRFKDRCPEAYDLCDKEPPFEEISRDHHVACWKRKEKK